MNDAPPSRETQADSVVERRDAVGRLLETVSLRDGRPHGPHRQFAGDGTPIRAAHFADGLLDGLATDYDAKGRPLAETRWVAGRREGLARVWRDGRLALETTWRDGVLNGPLRAFDPGGWLAVETPHRDGVPDGQMRVLDPDGRVVIREEWAAGLRHGDSVLYDPEGREIGRTRWVEGRPDRAAAGAEAAVATDPARAFLAALLADGRA